MRQPATHASLLRAVDVYRVNRLRIITLLMA
jgi:hypothetical protein